MAAVPVAFVVGALHQVGGLGVSLRAHEVAAAGQGPHGMGGDQGGALVDAGLLARQGVFGGSGQGLQGGLLGFDAGNVLGFNVAVPVAGALLLALFRLRVLSSWSLLLAGLRVVWRGVTFPGGHRSCCLHSKYYTSG